MNTKLRKPLFFIAVVCVALVVSVELGSTARLNKLSTEAAASLDVPTPGHGVPYLALLDGLILYTVVLMGISLLVPERIHGRIQGFAGLVISFTLLLACIGFAIAAFSFLMLMVTLLLSFPFGTIAYFIIYGDFDRVGAGVALGLIMTLKLFAAGFLIFAHQGFLQNKGLVLIFATSFALTFVVGLLHSLVPGVFVSITDAVAGIVAGIVAAVWAGVFFGGSVFSVAKAVH